MEHRDHLTLKVGEVRHVTLQSRGAIGLQLVARVSDESVVLVERQELTAADIFKPVSAMIGGPVPAMFAITALRAGAAVVTFAETRVWDKHFKEIIQKEFAIEVRG